MSIKSKFKNLYSKHIKCSKIFLLAGLVGGMSACKDVMEPDAPGKTQIPMTSSQYTDLIGSNVYGDNFMQHLSDIDGAKFYIEGSEMFNFVTGGTGYVTALYAYSEPYCNPREEWINYRCLTGQTLEIADRVDGSYSDSLAFFKIPNQYTFMVDSCAGNPTEDWAIYEVDQYSYDSIFSIMSDTALAQYAKNHLDALNADSCHINHICDAISAGKGNWIINNEEPIALMSKGSKIGLNHSDIGIVQGTVRIQGEPEKREHFPYFGGVENKRVGAPVEPTKFSGRAYAVINDNYAYRVDDYDHWGNGTNAMRIVSTDSAAATFSHGTEADTLTMPFNDWYTVQIITKNGIQQIEYNIGNNQSASWTLDNQGQNSATMSTIETPIGYDYYNAQYGTNNSSLELYLSQPDYYGASSDFTTGLDNVYCAPVRKAKASNDKNTSEVVMHGVIEEKRVVSDSRTTGLQTTFVFGGIRQNQR